MSADPARIILKRSLSLSRTYVILSIVVAANGLLVASAGITAPNNLPLLSGKLHSSTALPLLSIPLMAAGALTLTIPVILLFVYDKNNGVLERFLSLGLSQADIYRRYLKASITLALVFVIVDVVIYALVGILVGTDGRLLLEASAVFIVLAFSIVTLICMVMMSFSSLQKQRVGANQPLGIGLGGLAFLPYYVIPFSLPAREAMVVEMALGIAIGAISVVLLLLSSKLISREKLLP